MPILKNFVDKLHTNLGTKTLNPFGWSDYLAYSAA